MRKILAAGLLLAALSGVAACGDDGDGGGGGTSAKSAASALAKLGAEDKAAAEAVSSKLGDETGGVGDVSESERTCVAVELVKSLGAKRVMELAEEDKLAMPKAEAEKAADAFIGCVDVQALFAAGMSEDGDISAKSAKCLAGKVSKAEWRTMLIGVFSGDEDGATAGLMATVMKGMGDCLSKEELTKLGN